MQKSELSFLTVAVCLMKSGEFQFPPSVVGPDQCLNVLTDEVEGQTPQINQTLATHLSPLLFKLLEQIFFINNKRCCPTPLLQAHL